MTTTFLTTIAGDQARPYMPATPIMVTATSYWRIGQRRQKWRSSGKIPPVKLPPHIPEVAADSGGFEAARKHNGQYPFSFEAYTEWLSTIPNLTWAALPDLPVEREIAATFASMRERQELTLGYARELWGESTEHSEYARVPWCWVPTVQGRDVDDYVWMAEQLKPLLLDQLLDYDYTAYAEDRYFHGEEISEEAQARYDEAEHGAEYRRVGIGSLCKRETVSEIVEIVRAVAEVLPGQSFHLWGVKLNALAALRDAGLLPLIASTDSSAWNNRFGSDLEAPKLSGLTQRDYLWNVQWPKYIAKVDAALGGPAVLEPASRQLSLPLAA